MAVTGQRTWTNRHRDGQRQGSTTSKCPTYAQLGQQRQQIGALLQCHRSRPKQAMWIIFGRNLLKLRSVGAPEPFPGITRDEVGHARHIKVSHAPVGAARFDRPLRAPQRRRALPRPHPICTGDFDDPLRVAARWMQAATGVRRKLVTPKASACGLG